ncbi:helicase-related protein [Ideonella sp. YS5]|uniref:helicase-related protein n=1 Tax=Ideonella sp. YS5 TaxID=3453714 RepID=UPI003EEA2113
MQKHSRTPARPAGPPSLPDPRHVSRLPPHIGQAQFNRIRHAAYALPQVVKPADYANGPDEPGSDEQMDRLGFVMVNKAAAGQRPSRWIDPALFDAALAHLEAVDLNADARSLMLERSTALEAAAVSRRAGQWSRLVRHPLPVPSTGWRVPVLFRVPVDPEVAWAFYRSGDEPALHAALGAPQPYPQAAELIAHFESLIERSRQLNPTHLESLLPRLQAEMAAHQPLRDDPAALPLLKTAADRAQDRWEHQVSELDTLASLNNELAFGGYPDTFEKARRLQRQVTLYVGPPNSGKTHAAFERLAQALDGAYLAPLRLLALEGRDRLVARGVPCSLLTGEENVPAPDARVVSSTIEMVGTNTIIDVAVIDEAQMIFDSSRGWAWTQAIVAVPAREVIIICSSYAVAAIERLLGLCGEACHIRRFERKQHVERLTHAVPVEGVKKGDAVVAFSRRDVLMLRDQISAAGHPVSVVYGALPPEVRRNEAERFASGQSHVLVATDAIGMGLNLPIQRVLFSTMSKFDGVADRPLNESEVHQIAGRAGRYGIHEEGFVGVLSEAEPGAARLLKELLVKPPRAPRDFKAPVAPNTWHVQTISSRLGKTKLREVLGVFVDRLKLDDQHFAVAELDAMLELAEGLDRHAGSLTLRERFVYAQAPADTRNEESLQEFLDWAWQHADTGRVGAPWFLGQVSSHSRLDAMEQALKACSLWLWLDLRFPGVYGRLDEVLALRAELNEGIERQLKGKRPLAQRRARRQFAR